MKRDCSTSGLFVENRFEIIRNSCEKKKDTEGGIIGTYNGYFPKTKQKKNDTQLNRSIIFSKRYK